MKSGSEKGLLNFRSMFKNFLLQEEIRRDLEKETQLKLELEQRHSEDDTYVEPGQEAPKEGGVRRGDNEKIAVPIISQMLFFIFILGFNVNFVRELNLCTLCKSWIF